MNSIVFITRCTRPENLSIIADSMKPALDSGHFWKIIFDTHILKNIETKYLNFLNDISCEYYFRGSKPGAFAHDNVNWIIENKVNSGQWINVIDDDNVLHPDLIPYFEKIKTDAKAIIVDQFVDHPLFGQKRRIAVPSHAVMGYVDMAQLIIDRDFILQENGGFDHRYEGDGTVIETLHTKFPEKFLFENQILSYLNHIPFFIKKNL